MNKGYKTDTTMKFYVSNIREYNLILQLAREENAAVLKIEPSKDYDDIEFYKIILQGEENHLKFIEFLFKKKQEEMNNTIKQTGVL